MGTSHMSAFYWIFLGLGWDSEAPPSPCLFMVFPKYKSLQGFALIQTHQPTQLAVPEKHFVFTFPPLLSRTLSTRGFNQQSLSFPISKRWLP